MVLESHCNLCKRYIGNDKAIYVISNIKYITKNRKNKPTHPTVCADCISKIKQVKTPSRLSDLFVYSKMDGINSAKRDLSYPSEYLLYRLAVIEFLIFGIILTILIMFGLI